MSTPKHDVSPNKLTPDEARQGTVERRPVLKVLIVSMILAGIAAIVLSIGFKF